MALKTAFLVFDGVAELDFVGPKDVFGASRLTGYPDDQTYTVSATADTVTCLGGLRVVPDYTYETAPQPDILFVPGTQDPTPQVQNQPLLEWVRRTSDRSQWTAGVCTGTAILVASGVARGKRVTTHWAALERLREMGGATVVEGVRYVADGSLVTSGGVLAGIDQALWLLGRVYGPSHAREVQHVLDYHPAPPYAADV